MKKPVGITWTRYGPDAILFCFGNVIDDELFYRGRAINEFLARRPVQGMIEFVVSYHAVLLEFESPITRTRAEEIASLLTTAGVEEQPQPVQEMKVPVIYNGPDLRRVAEHNRLSIEEVVALHAAPIYKVYAMGFSPGFPYLGDLDPRLHTPRLESPRKDVPAGAVAIGGAQTGVYPIRSPGGWNIIGQADVTLFKPLLLQSENPENAFYLKQGNRVKFVPVMAS